MSLYPEGVGARIRVRPQRIDVIDGSGHVGLPRIPKFRANHSSPTCLELSWPQLYQSTLEARLKCFQAANIDIITSFNFSPTQKQTQPALPKLARHGPQEERSSAGPFSRCDHPNGHHNRGLCPCGSTEAIIDIGKEHPGELGQGAAEHLPVLYERNSTANKAHRRVPRLHCGRGCTAIPLLYLGRQLCT